MQQESVPCLTLSITGPAENKLMHSMIETLTAVLSLFPLALFLSQLQNWKEGGQSLGSWTFRLSLKVWPSSCSQWWSVWSWWSSSSSSWSRHAFPRLYVEWQVTNRWRDAVTNWRTGGWGAVASSVPPDLCHFIQRINCPRLGSGANTDRVPGKGVAKPQNLKSRISRLQ